MSMTLPLARYRFTFRMAEPLRLPEYAGSLLSGGFVYYVSLTGITEAKLNDMASVRDNVAKIRKHTKTPVAVGLGVATPEDAARVAEAADGVIVGSAIVRRVGEHGQDGRLVHEVGSFVRSLKAAMQPG